MECTQGWSAAAGRGNSMNFHWNCWDLFGIFPLFPGPKRRCRGKNWILIGFIWDLGWFWGEKSFPGGEIPAWNSGLGFWGIFISYLGIFALDFGGVYSSFLGFSLLILGFFDSWFWGFYPNFNSIFPPALPAWIWVENPQIWLRKTGDYWEKKRRIWTSHLSFPH